MYAADLPAGTTFYHGTKADLKIDDLLSPGYGSNFVDRALAHIYFAATLDAAIWGAELSQDPGSHEGARGRIYIVEPTGPYEDDPNLTDKRFPGNPTMSYRSRDPLRVTGEVEDWVGHTPEQLQAMHDGLARLNAQGNAEIED